jgi:hypothetical protein
MSDNDGDDENGLVDLNSSDYFFNEKMMRPFNPIVAGRMDKN